MFAVGSLYVNYDVNMYDQSICSEKREYLVIICSCSVVMLTSGYVRGSQY